MTEEFNLSEKREEPTEDENAFYWESDIKEFIKRDTQLIIKHWNDKSVEELLNERNKLTGEKFK